MSNKMIEEVSEATGGFARTSKATHAGGDIKLYVASEIWNHRRNRSLVLIATHADGREFIGRLTFDEEITGQLLEGTGRETFPPSGPQPGGIDAQTFLRAVFDHAWEQGFRPPGFQDRPQEIKRIEQHLADMRALVFKGEEKPL